MILLLIIFTLFSFECFAIELTTEHIDEIKKVRVRSPLDEHEFSREDVTPSLKLEKTIPGVCSLYKTNTGQRTFTLHLHELTDKLQFDYTEAWRNLDYSFDGITGERKSSWAEQAQKIFLANKNFFESLNLQQLYSYYHHQYNKINAYKKIFSTGSKKKQKEQEAHFIIPPEYVKKLIEIEREPVKAPNPIIFAYLHNKILELEQ